MRMSGGVYLRMSGYDRIFDNIFYIIHYRPLYLACPDVLSLIEEILSRDGCGSSNPIQF